MNTKILDNGPPRRRATLSPGQETEIGAQKRQQLIAESSKTLSCSQSDPRAVSATVSAEALESLPPFLIGLLDYCPKQGCGVHHWIFRVARHLLAHFSEVETAELIKEKAQHCGRPLEKLEREIAAQVRNARLHRWQPTYPERYALRRERIAAFSALARRSND